MIRTIIVGLLLLGGSISLHACDVCGCSSGNLSLGLLPYYQASFIGVQGQYNAFRYRDYATQDRFYVANIWGRWYPHTRWQVFASVPYRVHQRWDESGIAALQGLGDAQVLVQHLVLKSSDSAKIGQQLWVGLGGKLPTASQPQGEWQDYPVHFRLGRPVWELQASLQYQLRIRHTGLMVQANFQEALHREGVYRFGWQQRTLANLFRTGQRKRLRYVVYGGIMHEYMARDVDGVYFQNDTGGQGTFANGGGEIYWKRWSLGALAQIPVNQTYAEGEIIFGSRFTLTMNFLL
ncbi:MAG: hypothetical protein AAFU33_03015 [Bacteroidota bacterium]